MDFFALRCFVEVVREGGFTRAAERVFRSQPAVSAQVHKLESELGAPLFDRSLPSPALTDRGRELYPRALRLLEEADALEAEFRSGDGELRGRLSLATGLTVIESFLPKILGTFRSQYPKVRLTLLNRTSEGIARAVLDGRAELGIGWLLGNNPRLRLQRAGTVRFAALSLKRTVQGAARVPRPEPEPEHLLKEPLLLFEKGIDLRSYMEGRLGPLGATLELPSVRSLIAYAEHGFGTAIVPVIGEPVFPEALERQNLDHVLPPLELQLCTREGSTPSRAAALLTEAALSAELPFPPARG
jgi:DNA-binding transcriptional LysR family regulator